jgi:hypothetical protein
MTANMLYVITLILVIVMSMLINTFNVFAFKPAYPGRSQIESNSSLDLSRINNQTSGGAPPTRGYSIIENNNQSVR